MKVKRIFRLYGIPQKTGVCNLNPFESALATIAEVYVKKYFMHSKFWFSRTFVYGNNSERGDYIELTATLVTHGGKNQIIWINSQTVGDAISSRKKKYETIQISSNK